MSIPKMVFCQDIDYNLIFDNGKEGKFYAKREANNEVWFKVVKPDIKKKLKNGNTTLVKGEEIKYLFECDCRNNLIKDVKNADGYKRVDNETVEQLIFDFSCSDLVYNTFIGKSEDGFNFYLGKIEDNGSYKNVWVKSEHLEDGSSDGENEQEMKMLNLKTGKLEKMDMSKVTFETGYNIKKYMIDCNNKKIGTIVKFTYNSKTNKLSENFHPTYFYDQGMTNIEYESQQIIFDKVCIKN